MVDTQQKGFGGFGITSSPVPSRAEGTRRYRAAGQSQIPRQMLYRLFRPLALLARLQRLLEAEVELLHCLSGVLTGTLSSSPQTL